MFKFLDSLFGRKAPSAAQPDSFTRLNQVAPLRQPAAKAEKHSFVCREPVLNRQERIAGYEFHLQQHLHQRLAGKSPVIRRAYDDALIRNLGLSGVDSLLGHRLAFMAIAPVSFANPLLSRLPGNNTVLLVDPLDDGSDQALLKGHLEEARNRGFKVGLQWRAELAAASLLPLCDFVRLSIPRFDGLEIADRVRQVRREGGATPPALLAADLDNSDEFQICFRAGFDYFHGPFVNRREDWHPPRSNIDPARVMQLLNQLKSGVDSAELAANIRQDPVIAYKLLRFINSAANGLQQEVTAIDQGLLILGRERFYRWLSLLLFDVQKSGYREQVLIEQALVRADLMERLGRRAGVDGDELFLTGLFSLLDKLLDRPQGDILAGITVPAEVAQALLGNGGPLAPFLALAVACESGTRQEIARRAAACRLDAVAVTQDMLEALVWASQVGE